MARAGDFPERLPVGLVSVADGNCVHKTRLVVDPVEDALVPDPNPPKVVPCLQLDAPGGRGWLPRASIRGRTLLTQAAVSRSSSLRAERAKVIA